MGFFDNLFGKNKKSEQTKKPKFDTLKIEKTADLAGMDAGSVLIA